MPIFGISLFGYEHVLGRDAILNRPLKVVVFNVSLVNRYTLQPLSILKHHSLVTSRKPVRVE